MPEDQQSAMIALLPITNDWCKIDLPHMTLVYAGEIPDLNPGEFNEIAKDVASLAMIAKPIYLRVTGVEVFGKGDANNPMVDVLKLMPTPELLGMRRSVEQWNKSEFPFSPHCTIGPQGSSASLDTVPSALAFDRIMVGWGEDQLTFWLKR